MAFRTMLIGAAALAVAGGAALAQSPFPPVGEQSPFPPVGQQSPFPPVGQQAPSAQQMPPCVEQFLAIRDEVDKRFQVTRAALEKRAPAPELCRLLTRFTESEIKMIKFTEQNAALCNMPANALESMKASHSKSMEYRKQACNAASAPRARPSEPSLSDLLSPPPTSRDNTRTGRGTLDSLGGNPIGR
jgi:hypothetical protein